MQDITGADVVLAPSHEHPVWVTFDADVQGAAIRAFEGRGCSTKHLQRAFSHRPGCDADSNLFQVGNDVLAETLTCIGAGKAPRVGLERHDTHAHTYREILHAIRLASLDQQEHYECAT